MLELLANPWLVGFVSPLLATGLAVFVKWSSQNDRLAKFTKEDVAVGQELTVTAIAALVVAVPGIARHSKEVAQRAIDAGLTTSIQPELAAAEVVVSTMLAVFVLTLGLWMVSTVVRKIGWQDSGDKLRWIPGVVIPLIFGLGSLFGSAFWIASTLEG